MGLLHVQRRSQVFSVDLRHRDIITIRSLDSETFPIELYDDSGDLLNFLPSGDLKKS